jgi:twitching motility protein PilI
MEQNTPLDLLLALERRGRRVARELPSSEEIRIPWNGVGVRIGTERVLVDMGEVREILVYPELTRVPGTQGWVRGVANVRGALVPVMDLRTYLGLPVRHNRDIRVLVLPHGGALVGLVVDEVLGLRHFTEDERLSEPAADTGPLSHFLHSAFRRDGDAWPVLNLHALVSSPGFQQVSQQ